MPSVAVADAAAAAAEPTDLADTSAVFRYAPSSWIIEMTWQGEERNGMEQNGTEWNGMERNGTEWNKMEWNACKVDEWNGMEWNKKMKGHVRDAEREGRAAQPDAGVSVASSSSSCAVVCGAPVQWLLGGGQSHQRIARRSSVVCDTPVQWLGVGSGHLLRITGL